MVDFAMVDLFLPIVKAIEDLVEPLERPVRMICRFSRVRREKNWNVS